MKLSLKNIGIIQNATIDISGITVIAGENGTGKSTVGKALYAFFNSLNNIEAKVRDERIQTVVNYLGKIERTGIAEEFIVYNLFQKGRKEREMIADIVVNTFLEEENDYNDFREKLLNLEKIYNAESYEKIKLDEIEKPLSNLYKALKIKDDEIMNKLVKKQFNTEFSKQIGNMFSVAESAIDLQIKEDKVSIIISSDGEFKVYNPQNFWVQPVYLDDPFIIDTPPKDFFDESREVGHKKELKKKLFTTNTEITVSEELLVEKKMNAIYDKISTICNGEIVQKEFNDWGYKIEGTEKMLALTNLSAGLKSFVILKQLLLNGAIEDNGTIIMDEPEIHLHPKWQLTFAEIIVLLQREFGLHILLNTHSPYFIYALEVYSRKYGVSDKCKYYLTSIIDGVAEIDDVSLNISKIYDVLAVPFQKLEDEIYTND